MILPAMRRHVRASDILFVLPGNGDVSRVNATGAMRTTGKRRSGEGEVTSPTTTG